MALTLHPEEARFSEEMEREHEIRNLKETVEALRDALEKQKAGTATEVAQAVAEAQTEIRDLKGTVSEMRMELERRKAEGGGGGAKGVGPIG